LHYLIKQSNYSNEITWYMQIKTLRFRV